MVLVFWLSCAVIGYVYAGYPALMAFRARLASRRASAHEPDRLPSVSIVVAVRNEGTRIAGRVENLLALDYPGAREIIIASDGSTDDTVAALARFGQAVQVIALPPGGKAAALNAAVARASHDLLVFTDARQRFAGDALIEIARPFSDPHVGAATGELVLDCEARGRRGLQERRLAAPGSVAAPERRVVRERRTIRSTIADGLGLYWRYEKTIRRCESAVYSTLGATGAIYAMRRSLWQPLPPETILDDVLAPMRVVLAGFRVVSTEKATAFDRGADDGAAEVRRKVRTLAGNFQILCLEPRLLLPWRNPVWLQYVSHKIGRLLVPYALLTLFASSVALAPRSALYAAALAAQCGLYLLAGYGSWLDLRSSLAARATARQPAPAWQPAERPGPQEALHG